MNYEEISRDVVSSLYKSYDSLKSSPLDQNLRILIELRVSQLNGCAYCCTLHTQEAEKSGIELSKIKNLPQWKESNLFSSAEKVALAWSESLTKLDKHHATIKEELLLYFSEHEIVDMTLSISIMNAFNRMKISLKNSKSCAMDFQPE